MVSRMSKAEVIKVNKELGRACTLRLSDGNNFTRGFNISQSAYNRCFKDEWTKFKVNKMQGLK